jgi:hypothetical protein
MGGKFIPNSDIMFREMAGAFARIIAEDPARFAVAAGDSESLSAAVKLYQESLQATRSGGARSQHTTRAKNDARREAERLIRQVANQIRANVSVDAQAKFALNLHERSARRKSRGKGGWRGGLQEPPRLWFVRARHEANAATPLHELRFCALDYSRARPEGVARLELFVDLLPPEAPIPGHPGANHAGRPWYLRSFTRSPIVLAPPMTRVPMRVVYWGRWSDSTGNVGPFSKTAAAWIEGGSEHLRGPRFPGTPGPMMMPMLEVDGCGGSGGGSAPRQLECNVMVLQAQYQSYLSAAVMPALEAAEPTVDPARLLRA